MRHPSQPIGRSDRHHRYSAPSGQRASGEIDLVDVLYSQADDLMETGDIRLALERAFRWGFQSADGDQRHGLQELLQELTQRRDHLARQIGHDGFLEALEPELDRVDGLDHAPVQAGQEQDTSRRSALDRMADRLEQGYSTDAARSEFEELLATLREGANPLEEGAPSAGSGQAGSSRMAPDPTTPLDSNRSAGERIVSMLFSGGMESNAGGRQATRHVRHDELRQRLAPDLITLQEFTRLERAIRDLTGLGSVANLPALALDQILDDLPDEQSEWLASWHREIERAKTGSPDGMGQSGLALPPEVARAIGADILHGLFKVVASPLAGDHQSLDRGNAGDSIAETRPWEPGQALDLNLVSTVFNAVKRNPQDVLGGRVRLRADDFDVVERSTAISLSTVLAVDRSRSMGQNGGWASAKRIGLALHELIRRSYPRDSLEMLVFSSNAEMVRIEDLPLIPWDKYEHGTSIQAALALARLALRRKRQGTRQVVLMTDGEPTLASVRGEDVFASPPDALILDQTMREVLRCTREGITINLVLLAESDVMREFAHQIAVHNKGRVFLAQPGNLGVSLLRDYLTR